MNIGHPAHQKVGSVSFSFYDTETIRKISVKQITVPVLFDDDNKPIKGGPYDTALGPFNKNDRCTTCQLSYFLCPGHFGHIELAVPVYNPLTFSQLISLYKNMCIYCHHFRQSPNKLLIWRIKLKLLKLGLYFEAKEVDQLVGQYSKITTAEDSLDRRAKANEKESELCESDGTLGDLNTMLKKYYKQCKKHLQEESLNIKPFKSSIVEQYKREIIDEFLQRFPSNRCQYCSGFAPAIHHANATKIFEIPLSQKYAAAMQTKGIKPTNIFESGLESIHASDDMDSDEEFAAQDTTVTKRKIEDAQVPSKSKTAKTHVESLRNYKYLTSLQIQERFRKLWENESELLSLIYGQSAHKASPSMFFVELIPVPPTRFRPPSEMNGQIFEHPQNFYLTSIIKLSDAILSVDAHHHASASESEAESVVSAATVSSKASFKEQPSLLEKTINNWIQLQEQVNYFYDSSKASTKGKNAAPGIKQVMEKKEGLFRKHMMGKRVNYAARSVISPDVNIETSEIGLPMVFATRLTYAEPVTRYNVHQLRQNVINGPKVHPGATHIEHEDGTLTSLDNFSLESRTALANQLLTPQGGLSDTLISKRVLRHVHDGDVLLLNRQPTLHKPSIMAHKCRVLPNEKTIRMHYANCNTYNADFDGDEMNIHFPQSELGRAEAYFIANTDNQYLVPTDGSPLRGLIQDHVVTGVLLTMRDCLLDREMYQHILYGSLPESTRRIITIPPAIMKPMKRWTGKQVITTLLLNLTAGYPRLNLESKTKIPGRLWGPFAKEESLVKFIDGYLVTGVLDKAQFGATAYGLAHACYELYGPPVTGQLLTALGKLFTKFLQVIGFTCRMDDLVLTASADAGRKDIIRRHALVGRSVAVEYVGLAESDSVSHPVSDREIQGALERVLRSDEALRGLDAAMKGKMNEVTTKIIEQCLPDGQWRPFPANNMSMMTMSGAKGSIVNFSQISGALGQQELEGRRVPIMVSGRSLPSFGAFDTSARAGGYITGRFLTGIRPQEYFFHCMAGREGLIDTAVKTSRSGYLQRCLVKHLESLKVHYDQTVRDSDGSILQFYYGEDALDVTKQKYLTHFGFLASNLKSLIQKYDPASALERIESDTAWKYARKAAAHPDKYEPTMSAYLPAVHLGSVSESFHASLEKYIQDNPDGLLKAKSKPELEKGDALTELNKSVKGIASVKQFRALMWLKYMRSLVEPGESVGVLAAQSVGEPSTQMTLNTFHFAGFGAKNVTLGIPRLREIIMTASKNIRTPTMSIPFKSAVSKEDANAIAQRLNRLTLSNLIVDVQVTEKIVEMKTGPRHKNRMRVYKSRLQFMTKEECKTRFLHLSPALLAEKIEQQFVSKLLDSLTRHAKSYKKTESGPSIVSRAADTVRHSSLEVDDGVDDDKDGIPEKRASSAPDDEQGTEAKVEDKKKKNKHQVNSYDDLDASSSENEQGSHSEAEEESKAGLTDAESEKEDWAAEESEGDRDEQELEEDQNEENEQDGPLITKKARSSVSPSESKAMSATTPSDLVSDFESPLKSVSFHPDSGLLSFELSYSINRPKVLLVSFIEQTLDRVVVQEVSSIKRCFVSEESILDPVTGVAQPSPVLATEGVNFHGFSELAASLALDKIYSNDIFAVLNTYGVEAARTVIMKEIAAVFAVYGISVDTRHLSLIADYMTFEGKYRAMNRVGISSSVSPFSKMTFETTFQFLKAATLFGDYDDLASPSARLVMGQVTPVGTGLVEVIQPIGL